MPRRNRRWRDRSRPDRDPSWRRGRAARQDPWPPLPRGRRPDPGGLPGLPPPAADPRPARSRVCGNCREWLDLDGGRGRCLHPGSGFMYPYADTPGCDFFSATR